MRGAPRTRGGGQPQRQTPIITLVAEQAMAQAAAADGAAAGGRRTTRRGGDVGPLHGLPIAHKDFSLTEGHSYDAGLKIMAEFVPDEDAPVVARVKAAGAITIGKTKTPEFGAGSQTYNDVFGETRNPYDLSKTCGRQFGRRGRRAGDGHGANRRRYRHRRVAAQPRQLLQRGRLPHNARPRWQRPLVDARCCGANGPDRRGCRPVAFSCRQASTRVRRSPSTLTPLTIGSRSMATSVALRVAWSRDLGGLPVDPRVSAVLEAQRQTLVEPAAK